MVNAKKTFQSIFKILKFTLLFITTTNIMNKYLLIILLLFFGANTAYSFNIQKRDTVSLPVRIIDSLLLSEKLDWSIRLVGNFKQQQFRLRNDNGKIYYKPNNPFGIGFGIANQKILIDILFNIKNEEEDRQTNKFAAEGGLTLKNNYFGFFIENVHGYSITNNINGFEEFRKDLSIASIGINYLRLFNAEHFSVRMMKAGETDQKKTSVSFGVGGFLLFNKLTTDDSIIPIHLQPYFNEQANINRLSAIGAGALAGIATYIVLPANFFIALSASPGIGLEYKEIRTETDNYIPTNPLVYKLDFFGALGYKREKFYINFTFATNMYANNLDFGNKRTLSITKSKLIFGYNVGKINFRPKKKKAY